MCFKGCLVCFKGCVACFDACEVSFTVSVSELLFSPSP